MTSLWNTPASIATGFCCANTVRAGARSVPPGDGGASLRGLARRIFRRNDAAAEAMPAVDEEFDARRPRTGRESRVIGRAFVTHLRRSGQRLVHREARRVREDRAQDRRGGRRFQRPVEMRYEVRRREVDAAVRSVGGRTDGGGIGDPHRGGGRARGQKLRRVPRGTLQDCGVAAGEPERAQRGEERPLVRRQHGLGECRAPTARASWPGPAMPLRAGWRRVPRCVRRRRCRSRGPSSCASGRECRRS